MKKLCVTRTDNGWKRFFDNAYLRCNAYLNDILLKCFHTLFLASIWAEMLF